MTLKKMNLTLALLPIVLAGCSTRTVPVAPQNLKLTGSVHGGQQPVIGATVQLFDATRSTPASARPLIASTVTTDASGSFSITGLYTCIDPTDQVYLSAAGGDPGAGVNDNLILLTALGDCGSLTPSTNVVINEVTTVAMVFAYTNFFNSQPVTAGGNINGGDAAAYQNFLSLVDPSSGTALGTNGADVMLKLNALGNSLATCVNQASAFGDTAACDQLLNVASPFSTGVQANSVTAVWIASLNPTYDVSAVYNLANPSAPFQPTAPSAPANWNMNLPN